MSGFIGRRAMRAVLALMVSAVLIVRFGLAPDLRYILTATDYIVLACSALFFAGLLAPFDIRSGIHGFREEKWLFLFTVLFAAAVIAVTVSSLTGGGPQPDSLFRRIVNLSIIYSILCSVRVFLAVLGTWALAHLSPAAILPVSFALVIVFGTFMLMLPRATPAGGISVVDAAFTSTSATCVTGLIVLNTAEDFTFFGQTVILLLIQVGGLGIMSFVAFFALFLGKGAGLREAMSLTRSMDISFVNDLKRIMGSIVGWTLAIESAGAFILYLIWSGQPTGWTTYATIWQSVFHSVSAFCNAGFSLNPALADTSAGLLGGTENLEGFAHLPGIALTIGTLIVLGGFGFMVLTTLSARALHRMRTGVKLRIPVQVKLVIRITLILIALGMALFLAMEWNSTLEGMTLTQKLANSFLQSVTPRTAGFNTVPTATLAPAVLWAFVVLMFIGASPGGTGGGVKTTTAGMMFMTVVSLLRGKPATEIWKRRIPSYDVKRAAAVVVLALLVFSLSTVLLLVSENGGPSGFGPFDCMFESMSAFGTVGLSTGPTPYLTWAGKVVIILTMFVGRVGPAAFAAATGSRVLMRYTYPEERINIG